jgi:enoyl-CoA hydratase/carnithine racemase
MPAPPELETLSIEIDGEVGTLTLNRPDSLNAMSPEMIFELTVASGWLADQAPLRGLVVTGAGDRAFSSGGDVNWFKGGVDDPEMDLPAERALELARDIEPVKNRLMLGVEPHLVR